MYSNLLLNEVNLYPELISMLYWLVFCKLYLRHWKYFAKKKVLKVLKFFIHFCWSFTLQHKQLITMDDSVPLSLKKKKKVFPLFLPFGIFLLSFYGVSFLLTIYLVKFKVFFLCSYPAYTPNLHLWFYHSFQCTKMNFSFPYNTILCCQNHQYFLLILAPVVLLFG